MVFAIEESPAGLPMREFEIRIPHGEEGEPTLVLNGEKKEVDTTKLLEVFELLA